MRGAALWMLLAACAGGADDDKTTTVPADGLTSSTTTSTPPTDPDPVDTGRTSTMEPLGDTSVLALPPPGTVANGRFSTADTCAECHDHSPSSSAMEDEAGRPVAPYDLWQGSMMANSARDPLWRAQVAAEVAATPAAAAAIEAKCLRCHAPMAAEDAALQGLPSLGFDDLRADTEGGDLARDGVSCTLCHQIEPDGLGDETSFAGGFATAGAGRIYGPHDQPFSHPMEMHSGFTPVAADHTTSSTLCATCHTLTTHALDGDGIATGGTVLEQAPFLEWELSSLSPDTSCQDCHLPTTSEDGVPIVTSIAHNPGGMDFPPVTPRSPYGRHVLVGGNTLVPALLRDHRDVLQPLASDAALEATIAAAREQLGHRTATLAIDPPQLVDGVLSFDVRIGVLTGHKLPTGIPVRRVWLATTIRDANGAAVFASGGWDDAGRLVDSEGQPYVSESAGGPLRAHVDRVERVDDVPVYEAVLADADGAPTFTLLRGEGWAKDNRLLPAGMVLSEAEQVGVGPVGVEGDADFLGGGDVVHFAVPLDGVATPLEVTVQAVYQPLSARWAAELSATGTPEAAALDVMLATAERGPEVMATATASTP
mgnify:CR=1 FL=1